MKKYKVTFTNNGNEELDGGEFRVLLQSNGAKFVNDASSGASVSGGVEETAGVSIEDTLFKASYNNFVAGSKITYIVAIDNEANTTNSQCSIKAMPPTSDIGYVDASSVHDASFGCSTQGGGVVPPTIRGLIYGTSAGFRGDLEFTRIIGENDSSDGLRDFYVTEKTYSLDLDTYEVTNATPDVGKVEVLDNGNIVLGLIDNTQPLTENISVTARVSIKDINGNISNLSTVEIQYRV